MESDKAFLGIGWSFPPEFDKSSRTVSLVSAERDINESLEILLSTSLGERVMRPEYGCNLKDYLFETVNNSFLGFIQDLVERAILYYEPRIKLENVEVTNAGSIDNIEGRLIIDVQYKIESTNTRYNYVYDFYLNEAEQSFR